MELIPEFGPGTSSLPSSNFASTPAPKSKKGNHDLHFFYDAQGRPAMIRYNGVSDYYFVYNLQGVGVAIVDDAGTQMVKYHYDAWGFPIGMSGSLKDTIVLLIFWQRRKSRYRFKVFSLWRVIHD